MTEGPIAAMAGAARVEKRSLLGLNALNFCVANMLTGFGPFLPVYLAANGWATTDIGYVLSVGTIAAVAAQIPAGLLVDAVRQRRLMVGVAIAGVMLSALLLSGFPEHWPVIGAEVLQGATASLITPAIAALTLTLSHHGDLGERLGGNVRFQALGGMLAALMMGYVGTRVSPGAVLLVAAGFGAVAILSLRAISLEDIRAAPRRTAHVTAVHWHIGSPRQRRRTDLWRDRNMQVFAGICFAFQFGNAALLPFTVADLQTAHVPNTDTVVGIAIVVAQTVTAVVSKPLGRLARVAGRRRVLLLAFLALTGRCILLSLYRGEIAVVAYQALDGVAGAVMGVMVPLVAADITHGGGRFNLAIGTLGLAMAFGATLSTSLGGFVAAHVGLGPFFLVMAVPAMLGGVLVGFVLPDTSHLVPREAHFGKVGHVA
jgi:MFS family permease